MFRVLAPTSQPRSLSQLSSPFNQQPRCAAQEDISDEPSARPPPEVTVCVEDEEPPEQHTMEKADWDTPVVIEPLELLLEEYKKPHQFQWSKGDDLDEQEPWWMSLKAEDGSEQPADGEQAKRKAGDAKKKVTVVADGAAR